MSSPSNKQFAPQHLTHKDSEPLPGAKGGEAPFDYSPSAIEKMKIPPGEEAQTQFKQHPQSNAVAHSCSCEHSEQCTNPLHHKQPIANQPPIRAPPNHHFFNADNPRPPPVERHDEI
ncbi:hypothetical protein FA15DRAFT_426213 [Coprinopsis marcescibilis]|uniref:Uncharacterized protein n=1 Tax=Coprinopsis marcescibilis TaxID=230819 RepID=A0A5C3L7V6_COPMA|nr:hypothetical protein FA15DRAFT_426213 [Coprinopsis marcescibilis]